MGSKFWGSAPLKFPGAQLGTILDYFRLRSQISPERIEISTSGERRFINYNPFHVRQKSVNFGPLTTEFGCLISTHPQSTFLDRHTCILALWGCGPRQIFTCATAHNIGDRGRQQFFNNENSTIGKKISRMSANTFGARESNITKRFHAMNHEAGMIILVQFLEDYLLTFGGGVGGKQKFHNSARFRTTLNFDRKYLRKDQDIGKRKRRYQPQSLSRTWKRFGEL